MLIDQFLTHFYLKFQNVFCIQHSILLAFHCITARGSLFPHKTTLPYLNDNFNKFTNSIIVSQQYDLKGW